jgi:hypothetical protein
VGRAISEVLPFAIAAGAGLAQAGVWGGQAAVGLIVFVVVASLTIAVSVSSISPAASALPMSSTDGGRGSRSTTPR